MKNLSISIETGNITEQKADLLFNSANGSGAMGSGTARQIADAGGYIRSGGQIYEKLIERAKSPMKEVVTYVKSVRHNPYKVEIESFEHVIIDRDSKPMELGDAFLTSSGDLAEIPGRAKDVVHLVAMDYEWEKQPNPPIIKATHESVRGSMLEGFRIANNLRCNSIAAPVPCTRKGGLTIEESSGAMMEALEGLNMIGGSVNHISIVLYSKELERQKKFFDNYFSVL